MDICSWVVQLEFDVVSFYLSEEVPYYFHTDCTSLHCNQQLKSVSFTPHPCKLSLVLLILGIVTGERWNLKVVLICISLIAKNAKHFYVFHSHSSSLFWEFSACICTPVLDWLIWVFYTNFIDCITYFRYLSSVRCVVGKKKSIPI